MVPSILRFAEDVVECDLKMQGCFDGCTMFSTSRFGSSPRLVPDHVAALLPEPNSKNFW